MRAWAKNLFSLFYEAKGYSMIDDTKVTLLDCGKEFVCSRKQLWLQEEMNKQKDDLPLVSCLMITKNRVNIAKCALRSFMSQSYPHKELIILDDGEDEEFADYTDQHSDGDVHDLSQ